MKKFYNQSLLLALLITASCDENKNEAIDSFANEGGKSNEQGEVTLPSTGSLNKNSSNSSREKIEANLIYSAQEEMRKFDHPKLHVLVTEDEARQYILNKSDLSEILKDKNSIWSSEADLKKCVVSKFSLVTGLIGVPNEITLGMLPNLFNSDGDCNLNTILMMQIARQAVRLSEQKVPINAADFDNWVNLASSKVSVTRYTALILVDLVILNKEQEEKFYQLYAGEKNPEVLALIKQKIKK